MEIDGKNNRVISDSLQGTHCIFQQLCPNDTVLVKAHGDIGLD